MFAKFIFVALAATGLIFLCGCASLQLNYNTLDLASSLDDLVTKQILHNISATLDNPYAVPSQVAVAAGTVQTSNSVTPTLTSPLSNTRTATNTVAATITSAIATTVTGKSLSVSANDVWQQAWTLDPVSTDSDRARRLRALYRYVTNYYGSSGNPKHTPAAQFMCDYPIQSAAAPAQSSSPAGSQNTASNSFQTGVITANGYEIIRLTRVLRSAMKLKAWEKARIVEQNIEAVSSKLRAQAEAMPELAVLANQKLDEIQETLSKLPGT